MKSKKLSQEFRRELANAIRLSVFVTAIVLGFLVFQNQTANREELRLEADRSCVESGGRRVPASESVPDRDRVECRNREAAPGTGD